MSKELFKKFARKNPSLANTVLNGTATWQQLYELYEIYGENNSIWNPYLNTKEDTPIGSFKDLFQTLKNLDMDSVQKGVTNLQKTIGLLQEIGVGNSLEKRPIYKRFDD